VFEQHLVHDADDVKVTLARYGADPVIVIGGEVVLEAGADVVWFTFPGLWHDVGRFHRADGTFTGLYANILTPAVLDGAEWDTTDLFLDVWVSPDGRISLLDEDEMEEALDRAWLDAPTAARAREEADQLVAAAAAGSWPPASVHHWTRERCREALAGR
jgi:predicted RNA-binding protein associated with RNAse of E/G family